ncbi:MAG TPA: hypothetical protein VIJ65_01510 [Acidobacteriaceae bacterium]
MLADEPKLHWCWIDMRPRQRRRVAVVFTYAFLLIVPIAMSDYSSHPGWAIAGLIAGMETFVWLSVMRRNGIVKRFEPKSSMRIKGMGDVVFVEGLDQWAQYFYGAPNFDAASPAQQDELLSRFKPGKRLFPAKRAVSDTPWLDERELKERDSAERWTARQVMVVLYACAGIYTSWAINQRPVHPLEVATVFVMCGVALQTLPRARVLWTESDPRDMPGELALIEQADI